MQISLRRAATTRPVRKAWTCRTSGGNSRQVFLYHKEGYSQGRDMNTNPFEDPELTYRVLINDEGQHSLWPSFADVPAGWRVVRDEDTREACMRYIKDNWTDIRLRST